MSSQLSVVMKSTTKQDDYICTNISCKGRLHPEIRTTSVPVVIFDCEEWAKHWIEKQPKEPGVSYFVIGVDNDPDME